MKNAYFMKTDSVCCFVLVALMAVILLASIISCQQEPMYMGNVVVSEPEPEPDPEPEPVPEKEVEPAQEPEPEAPPVYENHWTTVVYMAADNDLEENALDDFREMLSAAEGLDAAGHTVLVLLDRAVGHDASAFNWTDTRLFKVEPVENASAVNDFSFLQIDCPPLGLAVQEKTELDMAESGTLRKLLQFAQTEYPADEYALVVWGHGCGWRGYVVDEDSDDIMTLAELHDALTGLDKSLAVIAFDCCYGAMLETAYELRHDADVLVASERDEPAGGWNYALFLQELVQWGASGNDDTAAEGYARCAVNAFARQYAGFRGVSLTAVRLPAVEGVFSSFDSFAASCAACLQTRESSAFFSSQIVSGSSVFLSGEYPAYAFVDIESLSDSFLERGLPSCSAALVTPVQSVATELKEALAASTVVSFTGGSGFSAGMSETPMLAVYLATMRAGGVVDAEYPQLYVRGSGVSGQSSFVRDSTGWVPQFTVTQSTSLLDHLYRMPLP